MMLQITRTLFKGSSREELFTNQKEDKNALNDIGRECCQNWNSPDVEQFQETDIFTLLI